MTSHDRTASSRRRLRNGRGGLVGVVAFVLVATASVLAAYFADSGAVPREPQRPEAAATPSGGKPEKAPEDPPAEICGNDAVLGGPDSPPAGAVTVSTAENLGTLTDEHPEG